MPRRPLLATLAAAAAVAAGAPAAHAQAVIDPDLRGSMDDAPRGQRLAVLVLLDTPAPTAGGEAGGGPAGDGHAGQVRALREAAAAAQPPIDRLTSTADRRFWLVNAVATTATTAEIHTLARSPHVAWVGADQPTRVTTTTPTLTASGWGGGSATAWNLTQLGVPAAWADHHLDGTGVRIASIDTGVDAAHPALTGRLAAWRDFINASPTAYDDNGHGTHTIGTMVGRHRDGTPLGVAPNAQVVVAKAMDARGYGTGSTLIAAAQWVADPDGNPSTDDAPDIVNNSWGASGANDPWFRPIVQAWVQLGITPVFAAGNSGPTPTSIASPADYPESIAVGAVDQTQRIAGFSARGPVTWNDPDGTGPTAGTPLVKPDLVAPGVGITSTTPGGGTATYSGTSMAAPHISGIIALIRQARPDLTPPQIHDLLRHTATDLGAPGPDPDHGHGHANTTAALTAALTTTPTATTPTPPTAPTTPTSRTRRVTLTQLRTARRLAVTAAHRLHRTERRLLGPTRAHRIPAPPHVHRVTTRELTVTHRIATNVLRRTAQLANHTRRANRPRRTPHTQPTPTQLTPDTLRTTTRLARKALNATNRLARGTGNARPRSR